MKAVININGTQYLVSEGDEILVNRLKADNPITFSQVLLAFSESGVDVGNPYLPNAQVVAEKLKDEKGDKVRTFKYKAKSRYRKTFGFRPELTRLKITSIKSGIGENKPASKPRKTTSEKNS
jgi:large subunit ribosomal protein L21